MTGGIVQSGDGDWFSIPRFAKRQASAGAALKFFYDVEQIPSALWEVRIDTFLSLAVDQRSETRMRFRHELACLVVLHLPDFVLRLLQSNPSELGLSAEAWNSERQDLLSEIVNGWDEPLKIKTGIASFVQSFRRLDHLEPDEVRLEQSHSVSDSAASIVQDPTFQELILTSVSRDLVGSAKSEHPGAMVAARDADWFALTQYERRLRPVADALRFFSNDSPSLLVRYPTESIEIFLLSRPREESGPPVPTMMCLAALYLPNSFLRILTADHEEMSLTEADWRAERYHFAEALLYAGYEILSDAALATVLNDFKKKFGERARREKEGSPAAEEDDWYAAPMPALAITSDPAYMYALKDYAKKSPDDHRVKTQRLYLIAGMQLKATEADSEVFYSRLSLKQILQDRGKLHDYIWGYLGIASLLWLMKDMAIGGHLLISEAHAQTTVGAKNAYNPPFGLPLNIWIVNVEFFLLLLLVVLGVCLYKGFIAKPKNEGAAKLVVHFGMLALGIAFGKGNSLI